MKPSKEKAEFYKIYVRTSAVGIEVCLSILLGLALGYALDHFLGWGVWAFIGGLTIGMIAAGRRLYVFAKQYLKDNPDQNGQTKN